MLRAVSGGARNKALCRALADCLGVEITVARDPRNSGVRGVAAIAAAGLGWQPSVWAAASRFGTSPEAIYTPDATRQRYFERRFALYRDAYKRNAGWFRRSFESAGHD
jgi:xylulokinase